MPRESENEFKHLGGKVLNQMHSSCVKRGPATHLKKASQFDVLSDLKDLSTKADRIAERESQDDPGISDWFASIRKILIQIRESKNIKDIKNVQHPSSMKTFITMKDKEIIHTPAAKITPALKTVGATPIVNEVTSIEKSVISSDTTMITPATKHVSPFVKNVTTEVTKIITPTNSFRNKFNPSVILHQLSSTIMNATSNGSVPKSNLKPQNLMQTPVLNRTFDKVVNGTALNSGSSINSNQKSALLSVCDNSGVKTRSGSKKNLLNHDKTVISTIEAISKKTLENELTSGYGMLTRSGSKRKSSDIKNQSNKKQKMNSHDVSSTVSSKSAQSRHPLRDKNTNKAVIVASENKNKVSSVIKPPVQPKQSVVSKEQQILEEIKKKEKKREENILRIMAERQQKAEQNKKNREEKRTKTLQKRLQMEKEKEEKREIETKKPQVKINKENTKKTRTKELVEQHVKESKSSIISSTKQSTANTDALVKTPTNRKSEDIESYELTPIPDSSTYNFSDDEEDKPSNKRIPAWAQGVHLKSALIQQYYNPPNTDELFGSIIETPNLVEIFKINKKRYLKRTSSAIWNASPDRSLQH